MWRIKEVTPPPLSKVETKTGKKLAKATPNRKGPRKAIGWLEAYPEAGKVHLVWDNRNTHKEKPLVESFGKKEGHQIWQRLEVHNTSEHGSRLNQAEMATSIFTRQCQGKRHIGSFADLQKGNIPLGQIYE